MTRLSNLKLTYIASSFVSAYRITNFKPESKNYKRFVKTLDDFFMSIPHKYFNIGVLFNALTEKNKANHPYLQSLYDRGMEHIHADSGGLQAITLKKEITPELKKQIYTTQSNYSTYAMCFDEIPVSSIGSDSIITPMRYFQPLMLEDCAKKTGNNINEQIKVFKNNKDNRSKVLMIMQGNCIKTYTQWANTLWQTIKEENREYIGGVALGFAALNNTNYNILLALTGLLHSNIPKQYCSIIHLLGVGTLTRLMPAYNLMSSPLFNFIEEVTFDSTTHTKSYVYGTFTSPTKNMVKAGRSIKSDYQEFINDLFIEYNKFSPEDEHKMSREIFIETYKRFILYNTIGNKDKEDIEMSAFICSLHVLMCIKNFTKILDNFKTENIKGVPYFLFKKLKDVSNTDELYSILDVCYKDKFFDTERFEIYKEPNSIEDLI